MTAFLRRQGLPVASCTVDRLMRDLGLNGVRRGRAVRTTIPGKDGHRARDLLNRTFTATAPNSVWIADFTYVRAWAGFVYVAFVVDVFAQRIIAWHASTSKTTPLVLTPVRMATWQRAHDGQPVARGQLIHHHDAGSQGGFNWSSQHLEMTEVFDGSTAAASRSGFAARDALTGSAYPGKACGARVLVSDRAGQAQRGRRAHRRRVDAGRFALVSARWRHAAVEPGRTVRPLPVVPGT
jgi:hypothetical protein